EAKNRFEVGDKIEIMSPTGNQHITIDQMESENGDPRTAAPGSGHIVKLTVNTDQLSTKTLLLKEIEAPIHT
ncbi:MAG: U32 family peptidase C-terminal domain-containing protein, partial [Thiotrichaceae bacterium]|nr:U32 family peptidase C-terminal domain-containing protein [Thiotrichaceae bacterium]